MKKECGNNGKDLLHLNRGKTVTVSARKRNGSIRRSPIAGFKGGKLNKRRACHKKKKGSGGDRRRDSRIGS